MSGHRMHTWYPKVCMAIDRSTVVDDRGVGHYIACASFVAVNRGRAWDSGRDKA